MFEDLVEPLILLMENSKDAGAFKPALSHRFANQRAFL